MPIGVRRWRMSTVVKLSQTGRECGNPRASGWSEWSVKDTPGIGGACLLEEWANELGRDWFGVELASSRNV